MNINEYVVNVTYKNGGKESLLVEAYSIEAAKQKVLKCFPDAVINWVQ